MTPTQCAGEHITYTRSLAAIQCRIQATAQHFAAVKIGGQTNIDRWIRTELLRITAV